MNMNERLLRQWVQHLLLSEGQLELKHFQDERAMAAGIKETGNPVILRAWWAEDPTGPYGYSIGGKESRKYRESFKTLFDASLYYKDDGGIWKVETIRGGRNLELMSPKPLLPGDADFVAMKKGTKGDSSKSYTKVKVLSGTGRTGYMAINRIEHGIGGAKKSESIVSNQKMGKMAEYALKQTINGETPNFKEARIGADVAAMYTKSSDTMQKAARIQYKAVYDAAAAAIGDLKGSIMISDAVVPAGRTALVDVKAKVDNPNQPGSLQDIDIHVKYNDTGRKSGIGAGKELSRSAATKQTLEVREDGSAWITSAAEGVDPIPLAEFGARNPSTLLWKSAREKMLQEPGIEEALKDADFDTNVIQTGENRERYYEILDSVGYLDALTAYFNREYPVGGTGGPITAYAMFTSNAAGVKLEMQLWEMSADDEGAVWSVERNPAGAAVGLMYRVLFGDNYIFDIEFRSGPASTKKGHGGPPQIKAPKKAAGGVELPMTKKSLATVFGTSSEVKEEGKMKIIRDLIRETLLVEDLTKSDKKEIERIAKKQAKTHVAAELDKALGKNFLGSKGKVNKFVEDEISRRFKSGDKDKDFSDAVERVSKRVLQALHSMHFKRNNLIKTMPVPKS